MACGAATCLGRAISWVGLSGLFAVLFVSCDTFPGRERLGLTANRENEVVVSYELCEDELMTEIELSRRVSVDNDYVRIWEASSERGSTTSSFKLGEPPPGFKTATRMTESVQPRATYEIVVETNQQQHAADLFRPEELEVGLYKTADEDAVDPREFHTRAVESCHES